MKYMSWNTLAKTALVGFYTYGRGAVYFSKDGDVYYHWESSLPLEVLFYDPNTEFVIIKEWLNTETQITHVATIVMPLGSNVILLN